ncbi:hypothetical protein [Paraburkholderia aspalathi]|uniref:hypothetical protein n=1 Tax=Paraburkholderia aspalathi TaxID=1324617 RepID=UPI001B114510|nr:hypothetical protein [Paraburkholderia aspalathi]CAE6842273.1 hypothetical protein R20943_07171 [Paraburkholderia aspalathi]
MRLTISALAVSAIAFATPGIGHAADDSPKSVLTQAFVEGKANAALDANGQFAAPIAAVKKRTGNDGAVMIYAARILTFKEQPRCGRVAYVIAQPSAHLAWPDMGGQLNICEDGQPPLRTCAGHPDRLVLANSLCPDRSAPVDTAEVAAAIQAAVAGGSMTPEDASKMVRAQHGGATPGAKGQ